MLWLVIGVAGANSRRTSHCPRKDSMGSMDGRIDGQELWLKYESDYRREGDLPSNDTGVDQRAESGTGSMDARRFAL